MGFARENLLGDGRMGPEHGDGLVVCGTMRQSLARLFRLFSCHFSFAFPHGVIAELLLQHAWS